MKGDNTIRCPICLKWEVEDHQDLLCADCTNDKLEVIKNSCNDNTNINNAKRNEINHIFYIIDRIKHEESLHDVEKYYQSLNLETSFIAIKKLALQLIKLELINCHIKINNMERSKDSLQQKVITLNEKIVNTEEESSTWNNRLQGLNAKVLQDYQNNTKNISIDMFETKHERMTRITKQSIQLQYNNFKIFKELAFIDKSSTFKSKTKLLLFHQPIIKISDFFQFNNKLFQLNEFIENLIKLQCRLLDIFQDIKLPYIEELKSYLPGTEFYDLLQRKESFMMNGGKPDFDVDDDLNVDDDSKVIPLDMNEVDNERVVKLGSEIKLPLSSKTINNQLRRASMVRRESSALVSPKPSPSRSSRSPRPSVTPNKVDTTDNILPDDKDIPLTTSISPKTKMPPPNDKLPLKDETDPPSLKSRFAGKKVVIVPHKILTKPFTRLSSKEYLKFLLIIVKILINFQIFFTYTIDKIPSNYNNNILYDTLNTLNQLRGNDDKYSNYNFEKILYKIYSLSDYFEYKLSTIDAKNLETNLHSSTLTTSKLSSNWSSNNSPNFSYNDDIKDIYDSNINDNVVTDKRQPPYDDALMKKKSQRQLKEGNKLHQLYSNLFKDAVNKKLINQEQDIYGNFSETGNLSRKSSHNMMSPKNPSSPNPHSQSTSQWIDNNNPLDLRVIMKDIHDIMVNAKDRFDLNSIFKNPKLTLDTLNMMAQSKVQLDDWDVISKMY